MPPGMPNAWPNSTQEQKDALPDRIVDIGGSQLYWFRDNKVKTSKYEWYSFVPLFLLEEFNPRVKVANVYFLIIAALQMIPQISNTNGLPTFLLPLSIVVAINAAFAAVEDLGRHKADKESNSEIVNVFDRKTKTFNYMHSEDIMVGDIIRIDNRAIIPADCVVLAVHEKSEPAQGICFVETKQLDGETNLKTRFALPGTCPRVQDLDDLSKFDGRVTMEHPNNLIDSFTGVIDLTKTQIIVPGFEDYADEESNTEKVEGNRSRADSRMSTKSTKSGRSSIGMKHPFEPAPIQLENLLLRGCYLRNTDYAYALVLNTGHDTKIMMSATRGRMKASTMESSASEEIKRIMLMLVFLCLIGATGQTIWNDEYDYKDVWYLEGVGVANKGTNFIIAFFYFFLLHASCIPVSLYVSLSIARAGQTYFMNNDLEMYYPRLDTPGRVRTMNLNEDLGKVTHVFSDKTGTLTSNIMNFRKMSIGGKSYGKGITEIGKVSMRMQGKEVPEHILNDEQRAKDVSVQNVAFYCPDFVRDMELTRDFKSSKRIRLRTISGASSISELSTTSNNVGTGGHHGLFSDVAPSAMNQVQLNQTFFKILALCHDTIAERLVSGEVKLSASNPDDEALVAAAAYFGYKFVDRRDAICHIQNVESLTFAGEKLLQQQHQQQHHQQEASALVGRRTGGLIAPGSPIKEVEMTSMTDTASPTTDTVPSPQLQKEPQQSKYPSLPYDLDMREEIQVLTMIKFTSKRKRMSVIIRDTDGDIKLLIKGADTAMIPRFVGSQEQAALMHTTIKHVEQFSSEGLRCLLVGYKEIDELTFDEWVLRYEEALASVKELEKQKMGLPNLIETLEDEIEQGVGLIGATALEDKLQDGVPECIADLVKAGLVIWMLTGDKEETAINIAIACNLLAPEEYMDHIIINNKKAPDRGSMRRVLASELEAAQRSADQRGGEMLSGRPRALVIDGPSLTLVLEDEGPQPSGASDSETVPYEDNSNISQNSSAEFVPLMATLSGKSAVLEKSITPALGNSSSDSVDAPDGIAPSGTRTPPKHALSSSEREGDGACGKCMRSAPVQHHAGSADNTATTRMSSRRLLLELSKYCQAVVACRVSPDQKREMVDLIKGSAPDRESILTLAIGDGANDVPMIQGAHIGVGIRGEEGQQAVNNADYAIAQFEYLRPLLLKHGRYNYIRMSNEICYIFYKNVLVSLCMFWFNIFCGWSGQKYFAEGPIQMYNVLFTSIPILLYAIYDRDMDYDKVRAFPRIYATRDPGNSYFNSAIFWSWIATAIAEACVVCLLSVYLLEGYSSPRLGYHATFWSSGALAYSLVVIIVNLKVFSIQSGWYALAFFCILLSLVVWVVFAYGLNLSLAHSLFWDWYYVFNHVLSAPQAYVAMAFVIALAIIATVLVQGTIRMSFFSNRHILQEISKLGINPGETANDDGDDHDKEDNSREEDENEMKPVEAFESGREERTTSFVTMAHPTEELSAPQPV